MAASVHNESSPLLANHHHEPAEPGNHHGGNPETTIDFDPNGDIDNPLEWPAQFKWVIVSLLALASATVTFSCIGVVPIAKQIVEDLDHGKTSQAAQVLMVTIWEVGEAAGPLLIAPLSEIYGRYPVINIFNLLFIGASLLGAGSNSSTMFITTRILNGMTVGTNVLNPAIIGDMFIPEQRGTAMSLIMFAPLLGGTFGPAFSGFVAEILNWRYVLLVSVVMAVVCEIALLTCFRETYKVSILRARAAKAVKESPSQIIISDNSGNVKENTVSLYASIKRPVTVLFSSGVLLSLCVYSSVVFSYFYVFAVSLPGVIEDIYGMTPIDTGYAFIANGVGSLISIIICRFTIDNIYIKLKKANNGIGMPEFRLPISILGGLTLGPSSMLYGWCATYKWPIPILFLCVIWMRVSLLLAFVPVTAYVVDACGLYSASAITGVMVFRCLGGAFLPLLTNAMVDAMGHGWAFTVYGTLTVCLTIIPILLLRYGERWRRHSPYTRTD